MSRIKTNYYLIYQLSELEILISLYLHYNSIFDIIWVSNLYKQ